jgi:hypothetical protein
VPNVQPSQQVLGGNAVRLNAKNTANGYQMLRGIEAESAALVFFDPQYRAILDKMSYGNEGARQGERSSQVDARAAPSARRSKRRKGIAGEPTLLLKANPTVMPAALPKHAPGTTTSTPSSSGTCRRSRSTRRSSAAGSTTVIQHAAWCRF